MNKALSLDSANTATLSIWRQKLARHLLQVLCVLGLPVAGVTVYQAITEALVGQVPVRVSIYLILLIITFWRRITYPVQTLVLVSLFAGFGLFNLSQSGINGESSCFLLVAVVLAALFWGQRWGYVTLECVGLGLVGMAWAFTTGRMIVYYPGTQIPRQREVVRWAMYIAIFLSTGLGLQYAQNYMLARLADALERSHWLARDLDAERAGLAQLVQRRTAAAEQARAEAEDAAANLQAQVWQVTGLARISDVLRGEHELDMLANAVIAEICRYVEASVGALYLREGDTLRLWGRYAYTFSPEQPTHFALGEGLVGQAAQDKRMHVLDTMPDQQFVIASGLGHSTLRNLLVAPFIYADDARGVLEIGAQHPFTPPQITFIEQTLEPIAIAFNTAQNLGRINALLSQTRFQADELRIREEELRAINEELQTQAEMRRERGE